jgi:hypothetical protein
VGAIDSLLTLAEIAVAFAGFSSVVVLFSRRDEDGLQGFDRIRFRVMLLASLLAAFFAVLPLPLQELGVPHGLIWLICSGGLALYLGGGAIGQFRTRHLFTRPAERALSILFQLAAWTAFACLVLNVAGVGFHRQAGPYVLGVSWLLFQAGWQFYRLVSPPAPLNDRTHP